jgi:GNAT superfamily N-acetyltransferase
MSKDRLNDFYELFCLRGKNLSLDYFLKKYDTSWTGKEFIGIIVYDASGKAVGHLGTLPMFIDYKGKRHLCCQISDAIVHPEHHGKGLFALIIECVLEIAREENIEFLFVFPSPQAYNGFIKTGWVETDMLKTYCFTTPCLPFNKLVNKFNLLKTYNLFIKCILWLFAGTKKNSFYNSVIDEQTGGVVTDKDFILHKNYTYNYITRFKGFKIWWKIEDGLSVGDIERFDLNEVHRLQKALKSLCFLLGFHNYKITTTSNTYLDSVFSKLSTPKQGNKVFFYDLTSGIDFSNIKFSYSDLNTF